LPKKQIRINLRGKTQKKKKKREKGRIKANGLSPEKKVGGVQKSISQKKNNQKNRWPCEPIGEDYGNAYINITSLEAKGKHLGKREQ